MTATAISSIDNSHRRLVADLAWLPSDSQINFKGEILAREHRADGRSYQFMTLSGDGQCLVWDIRFVQIAAGDLPHIMKPRHAHNSGDGKKGKEEVAPWLPLFKMQLKRLEGVGELSLCRMALLANAAKTGDFVDYSKVGVAEGDDEAAGGDDNGPIDRRSQLLVSTEEGEIVFADWRAAAAEAKEGGGGGEKEGEEHQDAPEYVQWMAQDHGRPAVALQPSPFFPNIMVSVGDWHFQIWMLGRQVPIFASPSSSIYLTCGRWSPTRPGILYIGKQDGNVDVWDLTDSSYRPSAVCTVSSMRVTSMEFLPKEEDEAGKSTRGQMLGVGDSVGNLHVFDMPRNLYRPQPNEKALMAMFLERELKRVDYVAERSAVREAESEAAGAASGDTADNNARPVEEIKEAPPPPPPGSGEEEKVSGEGDVLPPLDPEELAADEAAYQALESKFIEELGLEPEELPEQWHTAHKLMELNVVEETIDSVSSQ